MPSQYHCTMVESQGGGGVQRASRKILKIDRNRWLLAEKRGGRKGTPNKRTAALRARLAATDSGFDPYQPHSKAVLGGVSVGGRAASPFEPRPDAGQSRGTKQR